MTLPSDHEEMHILPREKPPPRLLSTAISTTSTAPVVVEARGHGKLIGVIFALLVMLGLGAMGVWHWYGYEVLHPSRPISVLKAIRQNLPAPPSPPLPITADLLHVTGIALGDVPLAIVNGKRLQEGEWLEVRTANGVGALRVVKIEDGVVHFGYAGQIVNATMTPGIAQKKPSP